METIGDRWRPADRRLVDDLLDLRELAQQRLAVFRENPHAVGSRKQQVAHPALSEFIALQTRVLAVTEALTLSPRARARTGKGSEQGGEDLVEWLHRDDELSFDAGTS